MLQTHGNDETGYGQMLSLLNTELAAGSIKQIRTEHHHVRGRLIYVESDQGWCPEPAFVEYEEPDFPGPPN